MLRKLIFHFHVFKNAGSTLEWTLQRQFPNQFRSFDGPTPWGTLTSQSITETIRANPDVTVFSSHQARLPFPEIPNTRVFKLAVLRHPIDRVASVYHFERQQREKTPGALKARSSSFAEYVRWRLGQLPGTTVLTNHQVAYFTPCVTQTVGSRPADLNAAIRSLRDFSVVGIVDRLEESFVFAELELAPHFAGIDLSFVRQNAIRGTGRSLDDRCVEVAEELGDESLMRELRERNILDQALYEYYQKRLEKRIAKIPDFPERLQHFRHRCDARQSADND